MPPACGVFPSRDPEGASAYLTGMRACYFINASLGAVSMPHALSPPLSCHMRLYSPQRSQPFMPPFIAYVARLRSTPNTSFVTRPHRGVMNARFSLPVCISRFDKPLSALLTIMWTACCATFLSFCIFPPRSWTLWGWQLQSAVKLSS